jgi:hypothetical protein
MLAVKIRDLILFLTGSLKSSVSSQVFFEVAQLMTVHYTVKRGKQSRYRPGVAQRVPENSGSQIS